MSRSKQILTFKPGDRVKLSGYFLACTGQRSGSEGAKIWTVKACSCERCNCPDLSERWVNTGEPTADLSYWTVEELAEHPYLRDRHVNAVNLVHHGKPSLRNEAPVIGKIYP